MTTVAPVTVRAEARTITPVPVLTFNSSRDGTTCVLSNDKSNDRGTCYRSNEVRTPPKKAGQATTSVSASTAGSSRWVHLER